MSVNTFTVESFLGSGAQHIVGRLTNGLLIKYPHCKGLKWDRSTSETVKKDLFTHRVWKNPIPPTDVVDSPVIDDGSSIIRRPYALITEEVRGRVFREQDLVDESICEKIRELLAKSLEIRKRTGAAVDFLGGEALVRFFQYLFKENKPGQLGAYNLILDNKEELNLIDTNLLDPRRSPVGVKWAINGSIDIQHVLMAEIIRDRDMIEECVKSNRSPKLTAAARKLFALSRRIEAKRDNATPQKQS